MYIIPWQRVSLFCCSGICRILLFMFWLLLIFLRCPTCLFRIIRGDLSACVLLHLTYRIRGKSGTSVTVTCTGYRHTKFPNSYPFSVSYVVTRELSVSETVLVINLINIYVQELGPGPRRLLVDHLLSVFRHCLPIEFAATIHLWWCHIHPQYKKAPTNDELSYWLIFICTVRFKWCMRFVHMISL